VTAAALPPRIAWAAVARCIATSVSLLAHRSVRQPRGNVNRRIEFADGSAARVYRETVLTDRVPVEPCVLVVCFRLRHVRGVGHAWFRAESILNTPLFVGFPGFVSKLWLAHDERGLYRGIYEWDGAESAERYARSLWRVLALVSEPRSIGYHRLPGDCRDGILDPSRWEGSDDDAGAWWRVVSVAESLT
jgi:hypothetical protein